MHVLSHVTAAPIKQHTSADTSLLYTFSAVPGTIFAASFQGCSSCVFLRHPIQGGQASPPSRCHQPHECAASQVWCSTSQAVCADTLQREAIADGAFGQTVNNFAKG